MALINQANLGQAAARPTHTHKDLDIQIVANGFIVRTGRTRGSEHYYNLDVMDIHVFQKAEQLAEWVETWGKGAKAEVAAATKVTK